MIVNYNSRDNTGQRRSFEILPMKAFVFSECTISLSHTHTPTTTHFELAGTHFLCSSKVIIIIFIWMLSMRQVCAFECEWERVVLWCAFRLGPTWVPLSTILFSCKWEIQLPLDKVLNRSFMIVLKGHMHEGQNVFSCTNEMLRRKRGY